MANSLAIVGNNAASTTSTSATNSSATSTTASTSASTALNGADEANLTPAAKAKLQLNASIVQASLTVSIGAQDNPLALVFKSALTGINEALSNAGLDPVESAVDQDNTPDGTAGRIVALSTGFYAAFKQQHAGEDDASVLQKFMDTIRGGFEKGFKEAQDILDGLSVLNGDIASNIDKTHDNVLKGYADFEAAQKQAIAAAAAPAPEKARESAAVSA